MANLTALESIWQRIGTTISPIVSGDDLDMGTGDISSTNVTSTSLTSGRIPYVSTGGLLVDSSDLIWNGSTLTISGGVATNDVQVGDDLLFPNANSVINFGSGDITLTYTSGILTFSGMTSMAFGGGNVSGIGTLGAGAITGTSFVIGDTSLNSTDWGYLKYVNQQLSTSSDVQFASIKNATLTIGRVVFTGITTFMEDSAKLTWGSDTLGVDTLSIASGSITDSTGNINFGTTLSGTGGILEIQSLVQTDQAYKAYGDGSAPYYGGAFIGKRIDSTITNGNTLFTLKGGGRESDSVDNDEAIEFRFAANGDWTPTSQGTQLFMYMTPQGGITSVHYYTLAPELFSVLTDESVTGDLYVSGSLTNDGGSDPPYVLYFNETRTHILELARRNVPPERAGGMIVFYNGKTEQEERFYPMTGEFKSIDGKLLETVKDGKPCYNANYKTAYYWDSNKGETRSRQVPVRNKIEIPDGKEINQLTGQLIDSIGIN